jgi:hypothetical protein
MSVYEFILYKYNNYTDWLHFTVYKNAYLQFRYTDWLYFTVYKNAYLQFRLATGVQKSFPSILAWSTKILYVRATAESIKNKILENKTHWNEIHVLCRF